MKKVLYKVEEVIQLINQNKYLILAGDEELLKQIPQGNWIGGSIPYFMGDNGGLFSKELIQVTEIPAFIKDIKFKSYGIVNIKDIYKDGFNNGFSVIIIPAFSDTHLSFAINAPDYKDFATKPLIGWISGTSLDAIGKITPKTFTGSGSGISDKNAVVMHVELPSDKYAEVSIVNIFEQGNGDVFEFYDTGFQASEALINGEKLNFADYVTKNKIDLRLPLVADYNGAMINISIRDIPGDNKVYFYAPVFEGVTYKFAAPLKDFVTQFSGVMPDKDIQNITFSCNCILNYLYSELEGKKTGNITGPFTFGEIAYQLMNQTMVNLDIRSL